MASSAIPPALFEATVPPVEGTFAPSSNGTVVNTPAPQLPEGAAVNVQTDDWEDVEVTAMTSLLVGFIMMTLFECLRGRRNRFCRSLYRQRHSLRYRKGNERLKRMSVKPYPRGFLRWIPSTWRVSDAEFYQQVGMDGYVALRFIKLCRRLCTFAAFIGVVFLLPIYERGINDNNGASRLSMANLEQGGQTLWCGVAFAYLFTFFFLYSLRREFLAFSDLRNDWLAGGDVARSTQTAYTVRVERIPRAFRSPAILQKFFSTLFPGQIHSATVCLGLEDLKALESERAKCLQALERCIIRQEALHVTQTVRPSWLGPKVDAMQYYGTRLAEVNQKLRPKQESKLEAAKHVERFRRKELRNMGASLENMALYFVDQLDRGGAEDEDGNARVSWIERRGGDREFPNAIEPHPLHTIVEVPQREGGESAAERADASAATAAADRWDTSSAVGGSSSEPPADQAESQQPQDMHQQQEEQPRLFRRGGSSGSGGSSGGGNGGGDIFDEEKGSSGGGGGGGGGVRPTRALSPVAEELDQRPISEGRERGSLRNFVHGSTGSIGGGGGRGRASGRGLGRRSSTRRGDRGRLHSGQKDDNDLSRGTSWKHLMVKRRASAATAEEQLALRLQAAEELINEQGEDLIRYNLDHARQMGSFHTSLGAGALGMANGRRSVAGPRLLAHVHPVRDRDESFDSNSGGSQQGSLYGSNSGMGGDYAGGNQSYNVNCSGGRGRHGRDLEGSGDDAAASAYAELDSIRSGSGDPLSLGQSAALAQAAVGATEIGEGGGGGGEVGEYIDSSPISSPCDSIVSSFFSVSSPLKKSTVAAMGRRWSSAEAGRGGSRGGGGGGRGDRGLGDLGGFYSGRGGAGGRGRRSSELVDRVDYGGRTVGPSPLSGSILLETEHVAAAPAPPDAVAPAAAAAAPSEPEGYQEVGQRSRLRRKGRGRRLGGVGTQAGDVLGDSQSINLRRQEAGGYSPRSTRSNEEQRSPTGLDWLVGGKSGGVLAHDLPRRRSFSTSSESLGGKPSGSSSGSRSGSKSRSRSRSPTLRSRSRSRAPGSGQEREPTSFGGHARRTAGRLTGVRRRAGDREGKEDTVHPGGGRGGEDPAEMRQLSATNVGPWPSSEEEEKEEAEEEEAGLRARRVAGVGQSALLAPSPLRPAAAEPLVLLLDEEINGKVETAAVATAEEDAAAAAGKEAQGEEEPPGGAAVAAGLGSSPPLSELVVIPASELPRYLEDHDDDNGAADHSLNEKSRTGGVGGAVNIPPPPSPRLSYTPPLAGGERIDETGEGEGAGKGKGKDDTVPNGNGSGGGSIRVDGINGVGGFNSCGDSSRLSETLSSNGNRSDVGLLRGMSGDGRSEALPAAAAGTVGAKGDIGADFISPTKLGTEGVRRRGGGRQKGALTQFPALFARKRRSPERAKGAVWEARGRRSAGDGDDGGLSPPQPMPSSFILASPKDRRRISPRSRSAPGGGGGSRNRTGDDSGESVNRRRLAALATARRRVGGDARWAAAAATARGSKSETFTRSASGKPFVPWEEEWGLDGSGDVGSGSKGGGGHRRDHSGMFGRESFPRPPGEALRDASAAVRETVRQGIFNINSGMTNRVRQTGHKVKRGMNEVKDTVKDTVKDLGREVGESVIEVADAVKILTKAGGMSGTGFVTFKCLSGRACAVSTLVTNRPEVFNLTPAPEPRDIVWKNVTNHVITVQNRKRLVNAGLAVGIIFWSAFVSSIQTLSKVNTIAQVFPFIKDAAAKNAFLTSLLEAYLPVTILLIIINLLYFALKAMALHLEGYKTYSEVERAVMSRYFFFHLANVFVTIGAGSIKDAISKILAQPKEILNVLGETVPRVAVYFINLIIVKVVAGLMLELCFGGRTLKFWRILVAETFTDPGLRTKAGRTRGAYEPSEPWYGRFFADFLLVMLIVFTFQVIAPVVAIVGFCYFVFAELIYKYQLLHCYWPLYESGGQFFHKLFQQLVVGAVAGQITLIGYMSIREGLKQWPFLLPLPVLVLYSSSRWRYAGQRMSNVLSLDKAVLQDVQNDINVRGGEAPVWKAFCPTAYLQPSLLPGDPNSEFSSSEVGEARDDSDVDVDGLLELDGNDQVIMGTYGKEERKRRASKLVRRASRRRSSSLLANPFAWLSSKGDDEDCRPRGSKPASSGGSEDGGIRRGPTRTMSSMLREGSIGSASSGGGGGGGNSQSDFSIA